MKRPEKVGSVVKTPGLDSNAFEVSTLTLPRQETALESRTKDSRCHLNLDFLGPGWTSCSIQKNSAIFPKQCKFCTSSYSDLKKTSNDYLYATYEGKTQKTYSVNVINDIIFNVQTHIVAVFKDYLIYDDIIELLKTSYRLGEAKDRLHKACDFYEKYSKVFPNYIALKEKSYMFKNIERKQKLIDKRQQALQSPHKEGNDEKCKKLLTNNFIKDLSKTASKLQTTKVKKMGVQELIEKYMENDSLSLLANTRCDAVEATFISKMQDEPGGALLTKAEAAKKKSADAHKAINDAKKFLKPLSGLLNGMISIQMPSISAKNSRKPELALKPIQKGLNWKLGIPSQRNGSSSKAGKIAPTICTPMNVNSQFNDKLSININLNLVVNNNNGGNVGTLSKGVSRAAASEAGTAANLKRYKSTGKVGPEIFGLENARTLPIPNSNQRQSRVISHHPSGSQGLMLKSRQDKMRATPVQKTYEDPMFAGRRSPTKVLVKGSRGNEEIILQRFNKGTTRKPSNPFLSPNNVNKRDVIFPTSPKVVFRGLASITPKTKYATKDKVSAGKDLRFTSAVSKYPYETSRKGGGGIYHK